MRQYNARQGRNQERANRAIAPRNFCKHNGQRLIFIFGALGYYKLGAFWKAEVAVVTFSVFDSAPVPKLLNIATGPSLQNFQTWESDSCSDSGYHRCNRNSAMFLLVICHIWKPGRLLLLKMKTGSGSSLSQIFDFGSGTGSERKTQDPAGVDSGTPDPWLQIFNGAKC